MKNALRLLLTATLSIGAAGSFVPSHVRAAETEKAPPGAVDARMLLKQCAAAGVFPETMVIHLSACLGGRDPGREDLPNELREQWEIDSKGVHRLAWNDQARDFVRVESRPLMTADLCGVLLNGKAVEIQQGKGEGPPTGFVASGYDAGSRSLQVRSQGRVLISLGETNGPILQLYAKTDAVAFGQLYEILASRAREAFKAQPAEAPKR